MAHDAHIITTWYFAMDEVTELTEAIEDNWGDHQDDADRFAVEADTWSDLASACQREVAC